MLKDGIYEQIVNTQIRNELSEMDLKKYDIELTHLSADDSRRILTIYISGVIDQALHYLLDSVPASRSEEALILQIRLCNDIVEEIRKHTKEPEFEDNVILEKGEILLSLYHKLNSARSISKRKVFRPETSIVENALFTGSGNEPSMLSEIKREIMSADSIDLLVSFIKWSAVRPLMTELKAFTERIGTRLRIITTTYIQATEYKAVYALAELPNTEVKINYDIRYARMHAKSYYFKRDTGYSTAYIGSSNLSKAALTTGMEWNVKVTQKESPDIMKKFEVSFESYWNNDAYETFDPDDPVCCEKLKAELTRNKYDGMGNRKLQSVIYPFAYQEEILERLKAEREVHGHYRNLVQAATGVGKTMIAAFDYKRFMKKNGHARLLFVAHRKEILEQSMQKFQEVLNDFNFGSLYVSGYKPHEIDHLFISIQSFNSAKFTEWTDRDYYDYIVVDEFHHAAAKSYQTLLEYYRPSVFLGLTATPERMDGKDILKYFNGRIASRMLLGEAIDRGLLSPFQYFGITDNVDYRKVKWSGGRYDAAELEKIYTSDMKRCTMILKSINYYVSDINTVRGLGFCVSVAHAEYMADCFNRQGIPSAALSAGSTDDFRHHVKNDLEQGKLKFIFVVDLYNEGVDIPSVNTILFLRPTESQTIFLQQLGRGLRRYPGKECLTVLDFIGRADKKYNFALKFEAMTGKQRKSLRKQVEEGFSDLPKGCYIELQKYAQEYVLENLNQTDNKKSVLVERVSTFEADTGKKLTLENFLDEYHLSLYQFYQSTGSRSLFRLKKWAGLIRDQKDVQDKTYRMLTGLFHIDSAVLLDYWIQYIDGERTVRSEEEQRMKNMLYYTFFRKDPKKMGFGSIDDGIENVLQEDFVREEVLEILKYNRSRICFVSVKNEYEFTCPLEVHCRYSIGQIMAAFGYFTETAAPEFREGVKYFPDKKTDIFLINLNKSEKDFSPSTMYEDYAVNSVLFHWQSQSQDSEQSSRIQRYIHHRQTGNIISLFVREFKKNGSYTAPYMFLGNADYVKHSGEKPVDFLWKLHEPIPAELLPKANKSIVM